MNIKFLTPARRELAEAIRYYDEERPGLGDEFRDAAWEAVGRIRAFPQGWQALGEKVRRCQLRRFPYGIIYATSAAEILVIAVAPLHREPQYWRSRIG